MLSNHININICQQIDISSAKLMHTFLQRQVIRSSGEPNDQVFEWICYMYMHQPQQSMNGEMRWCLYLAVESSVTDLTLTGVACYLFMAGGAILTRRAAALADLSLTVTPRVARHTRAVVGIHQILKFFLKNQINSCFPLKSHFLLMFKTLQEFSLFKCMRFTILY